MGLFGKDTHIDKVKILVKAAIKKAETGVKKGEEYRRTAHTSKDYGGGKVALISEVDARRSSEMIEAANKELAVELRKIADMIETREIYR